MRKKSLAIIFLSILIMIVISGCSGMSITLSKKEFVVPVGESISTDVADYVRASEEMLANMTVDVSGVNTDVVGKYTGKVLYGDESRSFTVIVADETAPLIEVSSNKS